MGWDITRRAAIAGLGAVLTTPAFANAPLTSLRPRMKGDGVVEAPIATPEQLVARAKLGGRVAYSVADLATGQALENREETVGTPPASVAKAITALYALDMLGSDHRFQTQVIATGGIVGGVVQGDLVLVGGGDPSLDTIRLALLAEGVKAAGIGAVRGRLLVYDAALTRVTRIDPEQPDHVGYNPGVSGIALNHNRVHFEWRRGAKGYDVTMQARARGYKPDVETARMRIEDRRLPVYTYRATPHFDDWSVAEKALGNGGARWLPVRLPGLYAGDVFRSLAKLHEITLPKAQIAEVLPEGQVVATVISEDLRSIVKGMLKYSNNLTAEMLGLAASIARTGQVPVGLEASASAMNAWAVEILGMTQPGLVDHSGLSGSSSMSAQDMCVGLVKAQRTELRALMKPFKMRDSKGRPLKDHPIKVDTKTGTLNFVSTLAGYLTTQSGDEMAFAIFTADAPRRARIPKAERERPSGSRSWDRRSRALQQRLIERWAALYRS